MTDEKQPETVKLICGMISADSILFGAAAEHLSEHFGAVDIDGEVMPFDFTGYYDQETGSPLFRKFLSFEELIEPSDLAGIKRRTNEIEEIFASDPGKKVPRPINIDPGYVAPSKLVLASMKDFSHRICLEGGVYGEVTLLYRKGWNALEWTFPDYGSGRYDSFLTDVRDLLMEKKKKKK